MALSNFNSYNGIDTDDDSAFYHMLNNVLRASAEERLLGS
jgi:hypothetical protein